MNKTMRTKIGAVMFTLGLITADSEWIVVPVALVLIGAWLMREVWYGCADHCKGDR